MKILTQTTTILDRCQAQQVGAEGKTGQEIDRMDAIEQYRAVEQRQATEFFIRQNGKLHNGGLR